MTYKSVHICDRCKREELIFTPGCSKFQYRYQPYIHFYEKEFDFCSTCSKEIIKLIIKTPD